MSTDSRPIILNRYFFPIQSVNAIPDHDKNGKKDGSATSVSRSIDPLRDEPDAFALQMDLQLDKENSENPSYNFQLTVVGLFKINIDVTNEEEAKNIVQAYGSQILIGVLRERLAELTRAGPWGAFYINFIHLPDFDYPSGADARKMARKKPQVKKKAIAKKLVTKKKTALKKQKVNRP